MKQGIQIVLLVNCLYPYGAYITDRVVLQRYFPGNTFFPVLFRFLLYSLGILSFLCYNRTVLTRAGSIRHKEPANQTYDKECDQCHRWKPPRAHHCVECRTCVFRMDHHCIWINNCIGARNQKYFCLFLGYSFLYTTYIVLLHITAFFIYCYRVPEGQMWDYFFKPRWSKVGFTTVILPSLLFAILIYFYLMSQYESILYNQTSVEQEQKLYGRPGHFIDNLEQIFGTNSFFWLLPVGPALKMNLLELLYDHNYVSKTSNYIEDIFELKSSQDYNFYEKYKYKY